MRSSLHVDIRAGHRWPLGFRLLLLAAVPLLGFAPGCHRESAKSDEARQAANVTSSTPKLIRPEKKDVRRTIERPGYNIESYERTPLYVKIAGYVRKWNYDIGDRVKENSVLAEIFNPEMEVELKQKEAVARQAAAEIERAKAAVQSAHAEYRHRKAQYNRLAPIARSGVLDAEQLDEARLLTESAQAAVDKAQADVSVAEARLEVANADREHVQALLLYTKVVAPFDGVVTHRNINTGDFVQPSDGKEAALFVVEKVDPVRVFVNVGELDAVWIRDGDKAIIHPQSLQGQAFNGTVTRLAGALHPQNRTLLTEIDLPNGEGRLMPGMFANVVLLAERKNVWALPLKALVIEKDQAFCYHRENGKIVRMPLRLGLVGDEFVEVLKKSTKMAPSGAGDQWADLTGLELVVADAAAQSDE